MTRRPRSDLFRAAVLPAFALLAQAVSPAAAQTEQRPLQSPPVLGVERGLPAASPTSPLAPLPDAQDTATARKRQAPSGVPVTRGEASLKLDIRYTDGARIWNPATRRYDAVKLRTYNGLLAAPTIAVKPGETVRMTLDNKLPDDNCDPGSNHNVPACFNWTNLHAHGLWVSPTGNSDNVLLEIKPGMAFQYEYNVPADHPSGTFWYHPHRHGSTALQVASGMAGTLIVRGNRTPMAGRQGDVDTILKGGDGLAFKETVMMFEQIPYACRDANGAIKTDPKTKQWVCDPGDVGTVDNYGDQFGPPVWGASGRFTLINGQVQPTYGDVKAGRIERWRLVHGGVRDTINLRIRKMRPGATTLDAVNPEQQIAWAAANCTGPGVGQWEFAADGLTRAEIERKDINVLQPGYRSDVLVVFPEPGDYCVINEPAPASGSVNAQDKPQSILAVVSARGGTAADDTTTIHDTLVAAADRLRVTRDVRARVKQDLDNGLKLSAFVPHRPIEPGEVTGTQQLAFNIDVSTTPPIFQVNGQPYSADRIDRQLTLGGVDEWTLTSNFATHPFHIHVNPFQIVKILNKDGVDVTDPAIPYEKRLAMEDNDPQYLDMKGLWKDTVFVKLNYQVVMRTRYQRYIGDFVLHCHILDHEDQGMMQNVRISLPKASPHIGKTTHLDH